MHLIIPASVRVRIRDAKRTRTPTRTLKSLKIRRVGLRLATLPVLAVLCGFAPRAWAVGNVFAGREQVIVRLAQELQADEAVWFRIVKDHRTLASGTVRVGADGTLTLPVALPEMKSGVALALSLVLRAGSEQGRPLCADETIWALAEQPFAADHNPAAPRTLWLYDPEGQTETAFRSIALTFETTKRPEALGALTNAIVVVGEGLSLESERGLWEMLMTSVARGNRVLLLAPAEGRLFPPAAWLQLSAGSADKLLRAPPRGGAAYKLDLKRWPPNGAVRVRFQLAGFRDQAVFEVHPETGSEAVTWTDATSGGSFAACGLNVISCWETVPAARWLLVEMLKKEP